MAKQHELDERIERVEVIIDRLENGELTPKEGEELHEEGREKFDEVREILDHGDGEITELPE